MKPTKLFVNPEDFDEFYVTYYARMRRFASTYMSVEDAENVVQDVFLFIWENKETIEIHTNTDAYVFTLIRNKCLDYLKHKTVEEEYASEYLLSISSLEKLETTFDSGVDIAAIVAEAINHLPTRCREVGMLWRMEGKTYKEAAEILSISNKTVENQMTIALKKLKAELKDYLPIISFFVSVL